MSQLFLGIDVGTASARAGVFDASGSLMGSASFEIDVYRGPGDFAEQSASNIWTSVCAATREAVAQSDVDPTQIAGIAFDATCSLVVVGPGGTPIPVGPSGDPDRNVILWMDHRATDQAHRINETKHSVLDFVGKTISPEMQTPKLLWLKENLKNTFNNAWQFFDLTDYLTWRATGSLARSSCTLTCKWTYLGHERKWDKSYLETVGLEEFAQENFERIGQEVVEPGTALATGLTATAAQDLGLSIGTPVAAGLIDAHAGGIGTVGAPQMGLVEETMAYVFGTSSCTMSSSRTPVLVPGVWGPYFSAMVPGFWLNEGGQSAAGAAIDQLICHHPASKEAAQMASSAGVSLPNWLAQRAEEAVSDLSEAAKIAGKIIVVPEFIGNRAPFADPNTRAVIAGIGMQSDIDSLVGLYIAGLCGLGYGLRQILEAQSESGIKVSSIVVSGGAGRTPIVRQILADTSGKTIFTPATNEPVLLGSAILGAVASGAFPDVATAMLAMSDISNKQQPAKGEVSDWHNKRYELFCDFQSLARSAAALEH